ncbi:MAG: hypothetical protein RR846_08870 [Oscillospiraceae bacterium]
MNVLALVLFLAYTVFVAILSWMATKKTKSAKSFSAGNGDMGMAVVVLSLASSFTSAATLMAMPGYVYQAGLSGIIYFNIFQTAGLLVGLMVVGRKVRSSDMVETTTSIPQWLRQHYNSKTIGHFFALQSVFLITFMVLVVMLMADMMSGVFKMDYSLAVVLTAVYVFAYSLVGGTYGHGWVGLVQSIIMIGIVIWIVFISVPDAQAWNAFVPAILAEDKYYFSVVNPNSLIFQDYFTVFYCAFIMGFCNIFQPHIFSKALYLKKGKSWSLTVVLSIVVISIFNLILVMGMFIRAKVPGLTNLDTVMNYYIVNYLGKVAVALMFVTVMAAAMSTLNGVIIGMCGNIGSDLIPEKTEAKKSLLYVRGIVAVVGVIVIVLALNPPDFLAVIGMWGYNILMASSFVPMICSLWFKKVSVVSVMLSSVVSIVLFIGLMLSGITINGAWACGWCIPASIITALVSELVIRMIHRSKVNSVQ